MKTGGGVYKGDPKGVKADCTLTIDDKNMVDMASGKLNGQQVGTDMNWMLSLLIILKLTTNSHSIGAAVAEWLSFWFADQEDRGSILSLATWIFRAQEPKAPVTYCDHALSGVRRPSVVR